MDKFIVENFHNRVCYKFHEEKTSNLCTCGKPREEHEFPLPADKWSLENNTKLKSCDTFGSILFTGYEYVSINHSPKFISFNCEKETLLEENVFNLLKKYWGFSEPKLIISVYGGHKNMQFSSCQQKKNFKQGLIEVMKTDTTWIFGGGSNIGIHKLISEAVQEFRLFHHGYENTVNLIGIGTWGVVRNYKSLITEQDSDQENNCRNREYTYENSYENVKRTVCLNAHYDGFLFCDDGTIEQYDKEAVFRREFETFVRKKVNASAVQILYEGGIRALESVYKSLTDHVPLVVIKDSGRTADIICKVMELPLNEKIRLNIRNILIRYNDSLKLNNDYQKLETCLFDMRTNYKNFIVIHDKLNPAMSLDKNILKAIVSSRLDTNLENMLQLTIRFDCHDLANSNVFSKSEYSALSSEVCRNEFYKVLIKNKPEFVQLFLENSFDIESFLQKDVMIKLFKESLLSHGHIFLTNDQLAVLKQGEDYCLNMISEIIQNLSGNILKAKNIFADFYFEESIILAEKNDKNDNGIKSNKENVQNQNSKPKMKTTYLFLWALLSGYTDLAEKLWKFGDDHVSSALMSSIILKNMKNLVLNSGHSEMSDKLLVASNKFQEMASCVINEAFSKNQNTTYDILTQSLKRWNNMSCLQIAISGQLMDFLYISACQSYSKTAWMGKLPPLLPIWKILIAIPLSFIVLKPFLNQSSSKRKTLSRKKSQQYSKSECESIKLNDFDNDHLKSSPNEVKLKTKSQDKTYFKTIKTFYLTPKVKFVIYLVSYVIFLFVFGYLNLVEMKPLNEVKSVKERAIELFVYIYIFSTFTEEIRQIVDQERRGIIHKLLSYFSGSWNVFDIVILLLFSLSVTMRFTLSHDNFIFVRCFFGVTFSMFCLRTMQFYLISPSIGPKVIMIRKMILDILFFLSIFTLFIISYGTLVQTLLHDHTELSLSLIKDIFYRPYFQTYGELMLEDFNVPSPCNTTICRTKYTTVIVGFAIFLLLSNVLLINLLIAMFGHTFNKIQEESGKYFAYIQIQLVEEFYQKPLLPPPLNFFNYFFMGISRLKKTSLGGHNTISIDSFLVKHLLYDENIRTSGFEEVCMESSMMKMQSRKDNQSNSTSSSKLFMEYLDRLNENQQYLMQEFKKLQKS